MPIQAALGALTGELVKYCKLLHSKVLGDDIQVVLQRVWVAGDVHNVLEVLHHLHTDRGIHHGVHRHSTPVRYGGRAVRAVVQQQAEDVQVLQPHAQAAGVPYSFNPTTAHAARLAPWVRCDTLTGSALGAQYFFDHLFFP